MSPISRTLFIATHNPKKAKEMITILSERFPKLNIKTLAETTVPEPEETGSTYQENALLKAHHACNILKEWCVADDAGLEIAAFGGEPGVYSKRFLGEETPFSEKNKIIIERMEGFSEKDRAARFFCAVAFCSPDEEATVFSATCEGIIARQVSGKGGFGYDPIFYLPELGCTMADLTDEQKHKISHRGKVLKQFGDFLKQKFNGAQSV